MNDIEKPDILAVFEYVGYPNPSPRREGWCKIRCFLHDDRTASASVSVELNRWRCFTCGISEDSYDVLMRERGISLPEAKRLAQEQLGGEWKTSERDSRKPARVRRSLWND